MGPACAEAIKATANREMKKTAFIFSAIAKKSKRHEEREGQKQNKQVSDNKAQGDKAQAEQGGKTPRPGWPLIGARTERLSNKEEIVREETALAVTTESIHGYRSEHTKHVQASNVMEDRQELNDSGEGL